MNKSIVTTSLVIATAMLGFASPVLAQAGRIYKINVKSSEGTKFVDCMRFNDDNQLLIDRNPYELSWMQLKLGTKKNTFQAVNVAEREGGTALPHAAIFHIAYSGKATAKKVTGDAINEFGPESFTIRGKAVSECDVTRRTRLRNPWGGGS